MLAVPSVIESPKHTTTGVSPGIVMSIASRTNQDAVGWGNAASPSSAPLAPAPGAVA